MDNSDTVRIDDKDVDLIIDGEKYYKINNINQTIFWHQL